ncbi:hypothetical protein Mapa_003072 [Marchantia paleacea]|nr:hypothetical protein Mapa_003072 [Marchantia paleacea]
MDFMRQLDFSQVQRGLLIVWIAFAGPVIVAAIPIKALDPLRRFWWPLIRRGKLLRSPDTAGRGLLKLTVPQSFFTHFYIVGLTLNTVLFLTSFAFACKCSSGVKNQFSSVVAQLTGAGGHHTLFAGEPVLVLGKFGPEAWKLVFLLLLMEIHLTRRLYECLFVSSFDPSARMSAIGYLIALGFYIVVPITLFLQSFTQESYTNAFKLFATQKLKQKGEEILESANEAPDFLNLISYLGHIGLRPYIGAGLMFFGAYHQNVCHEILAALRANDEPGSSKNYYIPTGDWFELVSCPHYLAEIVIYLGLVVASGGTHLVMYIMLALVVANLYLLAKPTHEWYLAKFDDYPNSRRAMIPYIA